MFDNLLKNRIMMVLPVAAAVLLAGCEEEEAANAPEPATIDLSQTEDLFSEPIKPNPLANDPTAVVVRVNGEDITRGEIMEMMAMAMQQFGGRVPPAQMQQIQGQIYAKIKNDLINKKLISAAVAAANIEVDPAKIEDALETITSRIPEGQTLEELLASQGETIETLKENIKDDLATRILLESQTENIADTTEAEGKEFYDANPAQFTKPESVSASHILIKFDDGETDEGKADKKAQLEKIRADIIAGTVTFEDAAKKNSDCPSSANGGSLGTFGKGQMVPEFEMTAFTQEIDEVGEIIETKYGYHIIKVTDHQEEGIVGFEEIKERLLEQLTNQKKQQAVAEYVKSLRDSATIEDLGM